MTCKPESQKQRLERIAVQILAGYRSNSEPRVNKIDTADAARIAIIEARELIKQLDALPIDE